MKNFTSILLLCLCVFLVSCGDDDSSIDDVDTEELDPVLLAPLVGNWTATSVTTTGCTDANSNGVNTCGDLLFCLFIQISDEGIYGISDNTDPELSEFTGGIIKSLTASSFLLCEPAILGGDEDCSSTITYSFTNATTLEISFTDEEAPGCTFSATFTKDS